MRGQEIEAQLCSGELSKSFETSSPTSALQAKCQARNGLLRRMRDEVAAKRLKKSR